jgi:hypothetical protein
VASIFIKACGLDKEGSSVTGTGLPISAEGSSDSLRSPDKVIISATLAIAAKQTNKSSGKK